jgi:hypothetical protein
MPLTSNFSFGDFFSFSHLSLSLSILTIMDIYKKRHIENNQQFKNYENTIDSIQSAIRREIPHLIQEFQLGVEETTFLNEFINDRGRNNSIYWL